MQQFHKRKCKLKIEEVGGQKEKKSLEAATKSLETDIEEYIITAEKENSQALLTKARFFRLTVCQKKGNIIIFRKHFSEIERKVEANLKHVSMMKLGIFCCLA